MEVRERTSLLREVSVRAPHGAHASDAEDQGTSVNLWHDANFRGDFGYILNFNLLLKMVGVCYFDPVLMAFHWSRCKLWLIRNLCLGGSSFMFFSCVKSKLPWIVCAETTKDCLYFNSRNFSSWTHVFT
ncbi:uncharacterized protein LOC130939542 [Arachis stenosperma]|uniref:uncharacterized protein LOC130939542 n=1 Tax=Arachis stenosperma TaxID=217475 RepID=UPI0025AD3870|nr:uncharacterized protein LOC130939542 [Arachis stenosperma]